MTTKELAAEALIVQNACNLSGVAHTFSRVMSDLWELARAEEKGTDWVNTHPIAIVWVDKMQSLTGGGYEASVYNILEALDEVRKLAETDNEQCTV